MTADANAWLPCKKYISLIGFIFYDTKDPAKYNGYMFVLIAENRNFIEINEDEIIGSGICIVDSNH